MSKLIVNEIEKYDAAQITVTGNLNVTGNISGTLTANLSDLVDVASTAPADGQVLTYDTVNGWQPEDSQGGEEYTISEISTNTTAQVNYLYVLTANLTLTLPATPSVGDRVALSNMSGTTTPTVARNGNLIAGLAEDLTIDVLNLSVEFIYSGASQGWIIFVDSILGTSGGGGSVDGNGTTNFISKWSDANTLTDSLISDNGTAVNIGGNLTFPNGNGIDFSASAGGGATSSLLDDYEEGTFDPTVIGSATAGAASYSTRAGNYTKIGRMVYFHLTVVWTGGTGSGTLIISGLPEVSENGFPYASVCIGSITNVGVSAGQYATARLNPNSDQIQMLQSVVGGGSTSGITYDSAGGLYISGHYNI